MILSAILAVAICGQHSSGGGMVGTGWSSTRPDLSARIAWMQQTPVGSLEWQSQVYWQSIAQQQAYQQMILNPPRPPYVIGPGGQPLAGPNGQITGYWTTSNAWFPWHP